MSVVCLRVGTWFHEEIIETNRVALFLCFLAFVVTFVVTRVITRNIRAGRGPFKDNISGTGTHIHHAVPGIILLVIGAFMSVATGAEHPWTDISAVMIGIGTSLVLDEFALILHLSDVYWADQGRVSVEVVSLAIACMALALVGFSPNLFTGDARDTPTLFGTAFAVLFQIGVLLVCVLKGKYEFALLGAFVPFLGLFCAIRMGRPDSRWAKRFYRGKRMARAEAKAKRFDARWGRYLDGVSDFIAGKPNDELRRMSPTPPSPPTPQAPATGTG
jgi:hypothetical protein